MDTIGEFPGLSPRNAFFKRTIDIFLSASGLFLTWWIILLGAGVASLASGGSGFFLQKRVGKGGKLFKVVKIRTMRLSADVNTTVTTSRDVRITRIGKILRKTKIDELPQLINVLMGDMSFVGPRPDVPGFADKLCGEDRIVLKVRPGITGPATLYFRNEEQLLASQADPEKYNQEIIYPLKVKLNKKYIYEYSVWKDVCYIYKTIFP
ncbi:sugar transferase [Patescibacteria group bacterium]|nr:sugar transferase [Patescibacteria group bacterium]